MMAAASTSFLTSVDEELLDTFTNGDKDFPPDGRIDNFKISKKASATDKAGLKYTNVHKQLDSFSTKAYDFKLISEFWKFVDRNRDGILDKQDKPDDS